MHTQYAHYWLIFASFLALVVQVWDLLKAAIALGAHVLVQERRNARKEIADVCVCVCVLLVIRNDTALFSLLFLLG